VHSYTKGSRGALSTRTHTASARPLSLTCKAFALLLLLGALLTGFAALPAWATAEPVCTPPPSGMVSWWGGDGNANDIIGTNHGTLVNGATFAPGKVGQAFSFDGVNDYVEASGVGDFGSNPFTVDFWMYSNSVGTGNFILGKNNADGGLGWDIRLHNSTIQIVGVNGWGLNIASDGSATPNAWHHIALSSTGSAVELYIDGVLKGSSARSAISSTSNPFWIGYAPSNYCYACGATVFNGLIDEVEIFNRALTAEEIAAIYNAGSAGKCRSCVTPPSNMVSWWKGENNADDSIDGNNGTLVNGATYAPGMVGQAFSLDGVNDYVDLGSSTAFDLADFTLDAWVYIDSSTNTGERRLISRDDYTVEGGDGREYYLLKSSSSANCGASNRPYVEINAGGVAGACSPYDLTTGWHYLAATRSGTTLKLYVDGAEVASTTAASTGIISPDAPLVIGTINPTQNIENFIGLVDEVEIFNRALSAEEIAAIANAGSAGKCRSCVTPPSNMVSWWKAEDNADDSIGTNNGTLMNEATFAPGMVGQAFSLDGVNDYVDAGTDAVFNFDNGTGEFTIDAWIRLNAYHPSLGSGIVGKATQGPFSGWTLMLLPDGALAFTGVGIWYVKTAPGSVTTGNWTHVAVTRSGSTYKLYVDGAEEGTTTGGFVQNLVTSTTSLRIGTVYIDSQFFNGLIDEVEIFDRALTAEEIAAIANAGSAGKCQATDTTPDAFTFTDVTGVPLNTEQTSNAITVNGITAPAAISIVGGEYELNSSGPWSSSAGTVVSGDTVRVRHTSAATYSTAVNTTLTIGGVSDIFTSTTLGPDLTGVWNPVSQICRRGRCTLLGSVMVRNQGNATAPTSRLRVILSDDAVMGGDTVLHESSIGQLRPGQSRTRPVNVPLPRGVNASGKYLFAVIDALNSVAETNETNNAPMYGPIP